MVTNSNQSEKWKRRFFASLLGIVVIVLLGLLVHSNWQMFQKRRAVKAQLRQLNRKIDALGRERATLQATINEENSQVIEEIAREQMSLKKPGEKVINIKKPEQKEEQQPKEKWWQKILAKIKFW